MTFQFTAPGLDDLLLDVVTVIELSDNDRKVAENRYGRLKPHLERPSSPLREYLLNSTSLIYPQGSMSIGATIISGTDEDRFDVDALVDMSVPTHWSNDEALDTCGYEPRGLTAQLERLAGMIKLEMQKAFLAGKGPDERNPRYELDKLNDRWPETQADRKTLADDMTFLLQELEKARNADIKDMLKIVAELFGERVKDKTYETFIKRNDQRPGRRTMTFERGTGTIIPASVVAAPAVVRAEVPRHNFHSEDDEK